MKEVSLYMVFMLMQVIGFSQINFSENPMELKQKQFEETIVKNCIVKQIHYIITANQQGKLRKKKELRSNVEFNLNGMAIVSESFFSNMHIRNERKYNKWNKSIELKGYINGHLQNNLTNEYDSLGKLLRTNYYTPNGKLKETKEVNNNGTISTDLNGNRKQSTEIEIDSINGIYSSKLLDSIGNMKYQNKYKLDEKGRIVEWEIIDNIQAKQSKVKYIYSDEGYSEEKYRYDSNGELEDKFVAEYDNRHLETKSYWYSANGTLKQLSIYEYEYCK